MPAPRSSYGIPDCRTQLDLFRTVPGDFAPRDAQDLMSWPFFSLAKSKRVKPIDFEMGAVRVNVEATPEHGNYLGCRHPDLGSEPNCRGA
jgi:plasmid replication initiation protein